MISCTFIYNNIHGVIDILVFTIQKDNMYILDFGIYMPKLLWNGKFPTHDSNQKNIKNKHTKRTCVTNYAHYSKKPHVSQIDSASFSIYVNQNYEHIIGHHKLIHMKWASCVLT